MNSSIETNRIQLLSSSHWQLQSLNVNEHLRGLDRIVHVESLKHDCCTISV